jgi:hypothetical protein
MTDSPIQLQKYLGGDGGVPAPDVTPVD